MSDSRTPDEMFDSIIDLVNEAREKGHALLLVSAHEPPNGTLVVRHGRANLEKYQMAISMLADMVVLVTSGTKVPLQKAIADIITVVSDIQRQLTEEN